MEDILNMDELDEIETDDFNSLEEVDDVNSLDEEITDVLDLNTKSLEFDNLETDIEDNLTELSEDDYYKGIETDEDLLDDSDSYNEPGELISSTGDFVIMNNSKESSFEFKIVDINDIVVTQRIRQVSSVEDMVRSIKSTGLLLPIMVAPTMTENTYVLLDGWRRLMGCAKAGKRNIPVIVNNNISTPEIPIVESMYNHSRKYTMKEMITYIEYLEKEKGILNPSMIEYLLQMNSGDYTKLKDILSDNDPDIVEKLYDGAYTIDMAFKKLEQRRKKESLEEKENKKAAKVYANEEESGADQIVGSGEEVNADGSLSEEQIQNLMINVENLDEGLEDTSLGDMLEEDKNIAGFEPHKQKTGEREYIDPIIKKTVMARDKSTCQCCKRGGEQYVDILDFHHIMPVSCSGTDTVENGIMLCVACHRMVHLYSTDDLHVDKALLEGKYEDLSEDKKERYPNEEIFEDEKMRLKRIIKLGSVIRKGIAAKGLNKKQYKEQHSNAGIGRRKPGVNAEQERD